MSAVNISEGRRADVLAELDAACGSVLLDRHTDPDHNRSVFTLAGADSDAVMTGVQALALAAGEVIDIAEHEGVHPRIGAVDVVPFVALGATPADAAEAAARDFGSWWAAHDVPVFWFDDAAADRRSLPEVRRDAFVRIAPDLGPPTPHATRGATAVAARRPLVAINCDLDRHDPELAREVARLVRERDGGLPGVRSLGFELVDGGCSQVSMNLVDLEQTGIETACDRVRQLVRVRAADVARVELVGLIPRAELDRCSGAFRAWSGLDDSVTVEGRAAARQGN